MSDELTWLDTGGRTSAFARRLNESGAVAGFGARGKGRARADDALAWDSYRGGPRALPASGRSAIAFGINDQGDRAGLIAHEHLQGDGRWTVFRPAVWRADGRLVAAATAGLDAFPRLIDESGRMAGATWWGYDAANGHTEAAFWPSAGEVAGLGVLEDGACSEAFGMDDAGSVVGAMDRVAEAGPHTSPWGTVDHSTLWQGETGQVRILPSLHAVRTGQRDWREWYSTHAAHAVDGGVDQVGAGTHVGYDADGVPVGAATVFLRASTCGQLVDTTHASGQVEDLSITHERSSRRGGAQG